MKRWDFGRLLELRLEFCLGKFYGTTMTVFMEVQGFRAYLEVHG